MLKGVIDDTQLFNDKLAEWQDFYNYHRPHGGLGGQTPTNASSRRPQQRPRVNDLHQLHNCEGHNTTVKANCEGHQRMSTSSTAIKGRAERAVLRRPGDPARVRLLADRGELRLSVCRSCDHR